MTAQTSWDDDYDKVTEGRAEILIPKDQQNVFYNHVQEFNRDLTLAVISEFTKEFLAKKNIHMAEFERNDPTVIQVGGDENNASGIDAGKPSYVYQGEKCEEGITILEALAASGLRSMRFAKELTGVKKIVANDISLPAYEAIMRNVKHNQVEDLVEAGNEDAVLFMHQNCGKDNGFDVVDIDPFGSASNFLDSAVKSVTCKGLLCVTCTDMAVLAGKYPETCWSKYNCIPAVTKAHGEQGLRILLGALSAAAAKYSRYIEPLLSVSVDFYVRVYVRVHYGPLKTKQASCKQIRMYRCSGCSSYYCQKLISKAANTEVFQTGIGPPVGPTCEHCGHKHRVCGPYWGDPLHDIDFVGRIVSLVQRFPNRFKTNKRIESMLTMITEELADVPFYYVNDQLSKVLKISAPSLKLFRSAILNSGYRVSSFHNNPASIKTDTPPVVIWDILRKYVESLPPRKKPLPVGTPAEQILSKPITSPNIDLTERQDWEAASRNKGITRFPQMPSCWGPKARAKVSMDGAIIMDGSLKEKSQRFQGKRKKKNKLNNSGKQIKIDAATS